MSFIFSLSTNSSELFPSDGLICPNEPRCSKNNAKGSFLFAFKGCIEGSSSKINNIIYISVNYCTVHSVKQLTYTHKKHDGHVTRTILTKKEKHCK